MKINSRGFSLLEVLTSILLMGLMAAMCLPVALTAGAQVNRRKLEAARIAKNLGEQLKAYVASDPTLLPNGGVIPGDACMANGKPCHAFEPGIHDLTSTLPASLQQTGATLVYLVSLKAVGSEWVPEVTIQINWNEPNI